MRHRNKVRKLGRKSSPRAALGRHVVNALFTHGRIETTLAKAKAFRPFAERQITVARRAAAARAAGETVVALNAFRRLIASLHDETVATRLVEEIAPKFADRPGGYTRILRTAKGRLGDNAPTAIFELVTHDAEAAAARQAEARAEADRKKAGRTAAAGRPATA